MSTLYTAEYWLNKCLELAARAQKKNEVPVGAIVVFENKIIGRGWNRREMRQSPTAHAELMAVEAAAKKIGSWRLENCDLYVTLEPCPMCAGVLQQARIRSVTYGAKDPKGGVESLEINIANHPRLNHRYEMKFAPHLRCSEILSEFFRRLRNKKIK